MAKKKGVKKNLRNLDIVEKYKEHDFNKSAACRDLGMSYRNLCYRLEKDGELRDMFREAEEGRIDMAESILMKLMKQGNTTALIFFLKIKGKKRGYIERQELSHEVATGEIDYFKNMYKECRQERKQKQC